MNNYDSPEFINVGIGEDISIKSLAESVKEIVAYDGKIIFDISKPDGTPRKLLDISKLNQVGWKASINLADGIKSTYQWYLENHADIRV